MIDIPLSLRLTVAFAALGALPGLMLARWLAELVRRRWSPSYAAARLRGRRHARRVRRARRLQSPAGADGPDSAPAGSTSARSARHERDTAETTGVRVFPELANRVALHLRLRRVTGCETHRQSRQGSPGTAGVSRGADVLPDGLPP